MTTWPRSTPKSLHSTPLPGAWKAGREPGVPGGGINGRWACSVDLHAYDPEAFTGSGSFPMSQLFASGGQNIGVSASTSVLPMNTQD